MALHTASSFVAHTDARCGDVRQASGRLGGDLLVPLLTTDVSAVTDQLRVAVSLARTSHASLHVVSPLAGDKQGPAETDTTDDVERDLLAWATEHVPEDGREWDGLGYTRSLLGNIRARLRATDVETLVVPGGAAVSRFRRGLVERVADRAECNVITVNGRHGFEEVPSILLAVADGPHSTLATDLATRIATDCDAWIDVLHVVDEDATDDRRERATERVEAAARRIDRPESTTTWVLEAGDVADAIVEQSAYYGLTVVGAPTKSRLRRFVFGSTNRDIRSDARSVVLSARRQPTAD